MCLGQSDRYETVVDTNIVQQIIDQRSRQAPWLTVILVPQMSFEAAPRELGRIPTQ
jgi:hypothetical protein